ncbi:hypothetical protein RRF57_002617 [Xylaria bambusicola]|uniref:Uncharacterized protein n=1 Tax=Xylaria bambusicola TaxID=326684 RepID=A0AAN7Z2M6_9PEZI
MNGDGSTIALLVYLLSKDIVALSQTQSLGDQTAYRKWMKGRYPNPSLPASMQMERTVTRQHVNGNLPSAFDMMFAYAR